MIIAKVVLDKITKIHSEKRGADGQYKLGLHETPGQFKTVNG